MINPLRLLHLAQKEPDPRIWTRVFTEALKESGELTLVADGGAMSEDERATLIREHDVLLTCWNCSAVPEQLASDRGRLEYLCNITGEMSRFVPECIVDSDVVVTNWGDYPACPVAEGAMALLLAVVKDLHVQIAEIEENGWRMDMHYHGGTLRNRRVGIYGFGVIGAAFYEMLEPFGARVAIYDPYVDKLPDKAFPVNSLEELFDFAEIIVIHAGLTEATRKSVDADLLARLPRHGVVINTARGAIIDQDALFNELESGRLRAGLDVLDPDYLPPDHPARKWRNLILTAHRIDQGWPDFNEEPTTLNEMQRICVDNLRRFATGQPLRYVFDKRRYQLST